MSLLRHALARGLSSGPTFNPVCEGVLGALTSAVGAENVTTSESGTVVGCVEYKSSSQSTVDTQYEKFQIWF